MLFFFSFFFYKHQADCFLTKADWAFFFNQRKNYEELQKGQQKVDIFFKNSDIYFFKDSGTIMTQKIF